MSDPLDPPWIRKWFERRIIDANGCWLIYDETPNNYVVETGVGNLHRWSWEYHNDRQMPLKTDAHHKCLVKGCWNPAHVIPLTRTEHMDEHVRINEGRPRYPL